MEDCVVIGLENSWPYWYIRVLKKLSDIKINLVYDVDNDEIIKLEDAQTKTEKKTKDGDTFKLIEDHKLFGKTKTISKIFNDIKNGIFPVIPDSIKNKIDSNLKMDNVYQKLLSQSEIIRKKMGKGDYIKDINEIINGLKKIEAGEGKCFNLATGNTVKKSSVNIYNDNDEIPLCLPKDFENAEDIFKQIEKEIIKFGKTKQKTRILSEEDIEKMNLGEGIPKKYGVDVKKEYTFEIPLNVDISETMKRYRKVLDKD